MENNFIRGGQDWPCQEAGKSFKVNGYLYAQQNGLTNVCAHVALRTAAARFHAAGDMTYREMNQLLGIDHVKVKMGDGNGLTYQQMQQVLEAAGARCFPADYAKPTAKPAPFQKYIYGSIESGYPAVLIFGTTDPDGALHAMPVFGHTLNQDTWVPSADLSYFKIGAGTIYIPSESWLSMFVAHVISTMPKKVQLDPVRAEAIGVDYLFTILPQLPTPKSPWAKRLKLYAGNNLLVLRPFLLSPSGYTTHLAKVQDWDRNPISPAMLAILKTRLPDEYLWMVELSVPELFSANLRKVGEVLIRAEARLSIQRDLSSFVLTRLPGYFALLSGGSATNPQYRFIPSGAEGHVELIGCKDATPFTPGHTTPL